MAYNTKKLNELSERLGIQLSFIDPSTQKEYKADTNSKKVICNSLGFPADTDEQVLSSLRKVRENEFKNFVPYTRVVKEWELKPFALEFIVPKSKENEIISWVLTLEDGTSSSGQFNVQETDFIEAELIGEREFQKRRTSFVLEAPLGYHTLTFLVDSKKTATNNQIKLIVVPQQCYMPENLQSGKRVWGFPIQLYAMPSTHNWGMGDFTDLKYFAAIAKDFGASLVGINPISALFADNPDDASPYYSSSRIFINPLYIDLDSVPEAADCIPYEQYKNSSRFIEILSFSKQSDLVEYPFIAEMKYTALGLLFDNFKAIHLDKNHEALTARGKAFLDFCDAHNDELTNFATFQMIRNVRAEMGKDIGCWWQWEKGYQTPNSAKIEEFQKEYADGILFIKYQQFLAFEQYDEAGKVYRDSGMCVGLYTDLPVGVGQNSSEVWSNQELFLPDVSVGAPPDGFNKKGQDWSLSGFNPVALKKEGYDLFIRIIRAVMGKAGAVRVDHAFGLYRLFLRVQKASGAYLTYPFKDLMGIIALESHRQKCLVIAEDLGTAPYGFNSLMRESNVLSFGIFHWLKNENGLIPPNEYEHNLLIASGTHDLPTCAALWKGLDLELSKKMKLITPEQYKGHKANREAERRHLLKAFSDQGLPITGCERAVGAVDPVCENMSAIMNGKILPSWFIPDTYAFLARTNSILLLVRIEDILEQEKQVNLPGTYLQYPNWRYKLPVLLEGLSTDERMIHVCEIINKERPA